jgi:hypothetical protein
MPRAKRAKFRKSIIFFAPLASFARDIPNFGCGYAVLCRPNAILRFTFRFGFHGDSLRRRFEKSSARLSRDFSSRGPMRARRGIAARYIKANSSRKGSRPFFPAPCSGPVVEWSSVSNLSGDNKSYLCVPLVPAQL